MFVDVALPIPGLSPLTYALPAETNLDLGTRVKVSLGRRRLLGVVIATYADSPLPLKAVKPIVQILDAAAPALTPELLQLGKWIAEYYRCSWGEALAAMLPPGKLSSATPPASITPTSAVAPGPVLSSFQSAALHTILEKLAQRIYAAFLLQGVTGSGKTEIYLRVIEQVLQSGRTAILLVPEIALTPQICSRMVQRFGPQVAMLHSGLTPQARTEAWYKLRQGRARIALGARSAIFAPVSDLGLIVMDEEYEGSYKQEDVPRYHARTVAEMRAKNNHALLLLGSATPALESYAQAQAGYYQLLSLPERVDNKKLPQIRLVDMSQELATAGRILLFSQELLQALAQRLTAGEQSILLLNRRGFAPWVMCPRCRYVVRCHHCSVNLVYHRQDNLLRCHRCGLTSAPQPVCPRCGTPCQRLAGAGTQRVESELQEYFPRARILRLDQDAVKKRGYLETTLSAFEQRQADILIGTQMVAKGMDFPWVTLVGIILADTALHLPDFRAEEKTFQLIVQVAGRAGRGGQPGLVLVQTMNPEHPILRLAQTQDYAAFYAREIQQRQELFYPPFSCLVNIVCRSPHAAAAKKAAEAIGQRLQANTGPQDLVLGPAPSPLERLAGESRFQILIKSPTPLTRNQLLDQLSNLKRPSRVRVTLDVDPYDLL